MKKFVPRRVDALIRSRTSMSRKDVVRCLKEGKVRVGDEVVLDPQQLIFDDENVWIGEEKLPPPQDPVVFALNKPAGLISASSSGIGKANIGPILEKMGEGLTHVGRLDKLTTGLLLITNDGDLCNALTDPSCEIEKKYHLRIQGSAKTLETKIEKLSFPIVNRNTKPEVVYEAKKVEIVDSDENETQIEMILIEGKNRQIRRMCAILHLELLHLHRISVGSVTIDDLAPSEFRKLSGAEMDALYAPFGGLDGFDNRRAKQIIEIFDSGGFLPGLAINVKNWKESYLV